MTVIQLSAALKKVARHNETLEFPVGPLTYTDTFNLYRLRTKVEDLFGNHSALMEKYGYSGEHHLDFIDLCENINSAGLDAYKEKHPVPLPPPLARDLMSSLKVLKNYLQNAHFDPLHDQELGLLSDLKSIQNVVSLRDSPDKESLEIKNSLTNYQTIKSDREDFGMYLDIIRDIYLKVLSYTNGAPVEQLYPSRDYV